LPLSLEPLRSAIFSRSGSKDVFPLAGTARVRKGADKKAMTPGTEETFPWTILTKRIWVLTI